MEQPLGEAFAPPYFSLIRTGWLLMLSFVLSVVASMLLARKMVTPIRALQEGAGRIGACGAAQDFGFGLASSMALPPELMLSSEDGQSKTTLGTI